MAMEHTFTATREGGMVTKNLTPVKAIRAKCLECSNFSATEVCKCEMSDCALYPFRFGKTGIKRNLTPEQRERLSNRLRQNIGMGV